MLSILADMKSGEVGTFDVPIPELRAGTVLVRTAFSAISAGTERTTVDTGKKTLLGKALARPDLVRQVLDFAKKNGFRAAYQKVQSHLDVYSSLGYSCAGTVMAVGEGVSEFQPGDRVACGGQGFASHSEINCVPRNLTVKVPEGVALDAACLTTIGAIAVQGLRQAKVTFGENVLVIGAGLLGVLTIQLALASGCRVIAVDSSSCRARDAMKFGASLGLLASDPALSDQVMQHTRSYGADAAIITASSSSAEPVELGARALRDCGRIVVLGQVPLGVSRDLLYQKELSLTLSRSYGPGRYDPDYEELGRDYPIGYVRWTERRNMEAFLQLLAAGALKLDPLLQLRCKIEQGQTVYEQLERSGEYTAILEYDSRVLSTSEPALISGLPKSSVSSNTLRIGCIGAGSFARSVIYPRLRNVRGVQLEAVAAATGGSALSAQKNFRFRQLLSPSDLFNSPDIDAVFVLSRHDSHASYVVSAIKKGKPVFVEKPLATSVEQLYDILNVYNCEVHNGRSPFVMVGFNRRFSPATTQIREFFSGRREPMAIHIRVNAGFLPREHWTQQETNGGRIIGEVCHFLDWIRFVVGSKFVSICARALPNEGRYNKDNLAIVASFADGSVGNILYLANGDKSIPKEFYEVFCDGSVAQLDDYRSSHLIRSGKRRHVNCHRDKGHQEELELTVKAILTGKPAPIPFDELVEVTLASFAVNDSLDYGMPVSLDDRNELGRGVRA